MKKRKGLLSIMLALVMVFAMMPLAAGTANADDTVDIDGLRYALNSDGTATIVDRTPMIPSDVTIPVSITNGENTYKVTGIKSGAFSGCGIKSVTFAQGSAVNSIGPSAFSGCSKIEEFVIPTGVEIIDTSVFSGCISLKEVTIPEGVTSISSAAFQSCTALKTVTIPASVKNINDAAFLGSGIESIVFAKGSKLGSIGDGSFFQCSSLKEVDLPDGLLTIGSGAFNACSALTKVSIPASVTTIGEDAFSGCTALTEIVYYGTQEQWEELTKNINLPDGVVIDCAQDISGAAVVLSKTAFIYNGKVQKPAVKTIGGKVLVEGTDFTVSFSASPKNAGTYTMTITGMNNYVGTTKATFRINKAANPMSVKGKTAKVKFKKLKKKAQTIKAGKAVKVSAAQGTMTYKLVSAKKGSKKIKLKKAKKQFKITAKTGKIKVKKKLKKGTYKLKIKVTAKGNANYKAKSQTVTVKVKVK